MGRYVPDRDWIQDVQDSYLFRTVGGGFKLMIRDNITLLSFLVLCFVLLLGIFGPMVAPYEPGERVRGEDGGLARAESPSFAHPLGTTHVGYDVLSRMLYGARPTVITGILGGTMIIGIGMTIGVTAGYVGGRVENILMRITDMAYGIPLIPFAIVLVTFLGVGFFSSIIVIGLILWRGNARVLRSQVLQVKERPFIKSVKAVGASDTRIILKHILPNVATMAILFFTIGVGYTIILQAGLAFLGVTNPFIPSWGIMARNAYESGFMAQYWWWSLPPGLMIAFTVLATFMFGRGYESVVSGKDADEMIVQAG